MVQNLEFCERRKTHPVAASFALMKSRRQLKKRFQNDHHQIPCTSPFGEKMTVSPYFQAFQPRLAGKMTTPKTVTFVN